MNALVAALAIAKALTSPVPDSASVVHPSEVTLSNGGLACVVASQQDMRRSAGRNPKQLHMLLCLDGHDGAVVGTMLRKNGSIYCAFTGVMDLNTGCGVVTGCGLYNEPIC